VLVYLGEAIERNRMNELTDELRKSDLQTLATEVREELANYEEKIRK